MAVAVADAVEAKSLAPVMKVAADPPIDPNIAIPNVSEPLVLYIAKVPGSKDVFLTPIKPRDKTITAEDIESSLYFLHVHVPEDEEIMKKAAPKSIPDPKPPPPPVHKDIPVMRQPQRLSQPSLAAPNQSRISVNNRPLPSIPQERNNEWPQILQPGPGMSRTQRPPALAINRKPVGHSVLSSSPQSNLQNQYNIQAGKRKPGEPGRGIPFSPPYPEVDVFPSAENFLSPKRETHTIQEVPEMGQVHELPTNEIKMLSPPNSARRRDSANSPYIGLLAPPVENNRRGSTTFESMLSPPLTSEGPLSSSIESIPPPSARLPASESKEYQFTLIRRDPVTGQQWNVATIYNHASKKILNEDQFTFETTPNWMNIVLSNPNYEKFNKTNTSFASTSHSCADLLSPMMSAVGGCAHDSGHAQFHRHLQMEFSKFNDWTPGHSKVLSQDRLEFGENSGVYGRASGEFGASQMSLVSNGGPRRRPRKTGFAFRSPWDGRCEFSSATGHSTLKCKHAMGPSLLSSEGTKATQISELRPNLPSMGPPSTLKLKPAPTNDSLVSQKRNSKLLGRFKNRFSRSTSSLGVFKRDARFSASILDLSLGQERAGGGFTGNHSKLGKLIIENEGLKMMDLLVAANMSVWWKSYEKR